jgi:hypothetical protein
VARFCFAVSLFRNAGHLDPQHFFSAGANRPGRDSTPVNVRKKLT